MTIESYRQRHAGRRIFLVGNGPSLLSTPLDRMRGDLTMAMNRIALIYERVQWRPSYFLCTTTNIARPEWRRDILATMGLGIPSFVWDQLAEYVDGYDNVSYLNCTHGGEVADHAPDEWWSYDVAERVCKFGSSMLVALQIAVYMGCNPIYLVGCDLGYQPERGLFRRARVQRLLRRMRLRSTDRNHFDPGYGTPGLSAAELNVNMIAAHELALRSANRIGVEILNATVGGELEVYPRADLGRLLGRPEGPG